MEKTRLLTSKLHYVLCVLLLTAARAGEEKGAVMRISADWLVASVEVPIEMNCLSRGGSCLKYANGTELYHPVWLVYRKLAFSPSLSDYLLGAGRKAG